MLAGTSRCTARARPSSLASRLSIHSSRLGAGRINALRRIRPFSSAVQQDERPLAGIKVVDLTRVLAGPLATMMLSDLGADVIKIESPKGGDDTRSWLPPFAPIPQPADALAEGSTGEAVTVPRPDLPPESAYFLQANRNKRSVTLNLKAEKGQEVIRRLIEEADVLVENYVPGKLAKFGLDYETVSKLNPKLVYCSVTGYGSTGPYALNPGYDVVIEAEAGLMHITGERDGRPVKVGVAVTDILTGHYAQSGILAALLRRGKTGKGGRVECSLFESQIASLANIASNYLIASTEASRWGTAHPSIVPYQVFRTADGYIMLAAGNDSQFRTLCSEQLLNRPEWAEDERFRTNSNRVKHREEVVRMVEEVLGERGTEGWCEVLKGKGLPFAPINNIAQTFAHPQALARGVVEEIDHPRAGKIKLSAAAVSYDGEKPKIYRAPPYLGQHTDEVLAELGYGLAEIDSMRAQGVV